MTFDTIAIGSGQAVPLATRLARGGAASIPFGHVARAIETDETAGLLARYALS